MKKEVWGVTNYNYGSRGPRGYSATIEAGDLIPVETTEEAKVVNRGDKHQAIFDFYMPIPEGRIKDVQVNGESVVDEDGIANIDIHIEDKPYASLERLGSYLYKVTFNELPEDDNLQLPITGACSSYVQDGKLYRNLDWSYDNGAEFLVVGKGFEGMAIIPGLNDGELDEDLIKQLPYHINDGKNEYGIMVSSHILYNDFDFVGTGSTPLTKIPFIVLSTLKSMDNIYSLTSLLNDISVNQYLIDSDYLLQFLVTDGNTTYVITPTDSGYVLVDASNNPKLANFKWVNRDTVSRSDNDIQLRPTGIERYNMMPCDLEDLKFTLAYEQPDRLSDFIGLRDTNKYSTDEQLLEVYNIARQMYLTRTRDGNTWQTLHSIVYSKNGIESLNVQENYDVNFVSVPVDLSDYATIDYVDEQISEVESEIPSIEGLATSEYVDEQVAEVRGEIPSIEGLASEDYVDEQIAEVKEEIPSLEGYATEDYVDNHHDSTKQNVISDLETIRSGAALGATALQSIPSEYVTETELAAYHDSTKQDTLTAGSNITIQNNVISATVEAGSDWSQVSNKPFNTIGDGLKVVSNELQADVEVPTKTSDLENDSGFIDNSALIGLATATYVDEQIDEVRDEIPSIEGLASETYVDDAIDELAEKKQNNLNAGTNITIDENDVISATAYTAGTGIDITNNVISATEIAEDEIFWARYDHTTYQEVVDAIEAGKLVKAYTGQRKFVNSVEYNYLVRLGAAILFYSLSNPLSTGSSISILSLTSDDEWDIEDRPYQPLLTAGTNITIDSNNVISATGGTPELFWCTYGTTTFNQIKSAVNNGKLPVVNKANDGIYVMSSITGIHAYFTHAYTQGVPANTIVKTLRCYGSSWESFTANLQNKLTAGSNITISNDTISATDTTYIAGSGIDITNNVISATGGGSEQLFICEYDVTSYNEIADAIDEGKIPVLIFGKDNVNYFNFVTVDNEHNTFIFSSHTDEELNQDSVGEIRFVSVDSDDNWKGWYQNLQRQLVPGSGILINDNSITYNPDVIASTVYVDDAVDGLDATLQLAIDKKQDTLTAGDNITIEEDSEGNTVISASGSAGSEWGSITGDIEDQDDLQHALGNKVDKGTIYGTNDGTNWTSITINNDTYDIPAGGSGGSYTFTNGLTETDGTVSWDLNDNLYANDSGQLIWEDKSESRSGVYISVRSNYHNALYLNNGSAGIYFQANKLASSNKGMVECSQKGNQMTMRTGNDAYTLYFQLNNMDYNHPVAQFFTTKGNTYVDLGTAARKLGNGYFFGDVLANNIPAPPSSDGKYKLTCNIVDGAISYAWEAEQPASGNSF